MATQVDIFNFALAGIGTRSTVAAVDENSAEAIQCRLFYDFSRKDALRRARWGFARADIPLTELGNSNDGTSRGSWGYKYAYPSDCIEARFILPASLAANIDSVPFGAQNMVKYIIATEKDDMDNDRRIILTNEPQATLVYTRDITNTDMFDAEFVKVLAAILANNIVIPLSGDKALVDRTNRAVETILIQAQVADGNETTVVNDVTPDWIRARGIEYDNSLPWNNSFRPTLE